MNWGKKMPKYQVHATWLRDGFIVNLSRDVVASWYTRGLVFMDKNHLCKGQRIVCRTPVREIGYSNPSLLLCFPGFCSIRMK